jgi:taurine dioxygenase
MGVSFRPLTDAIGAEALGVDLAAPIDGATFDRINQVWLERTILLFRGQRMTPEQQIAFTRRLGTLEVRTLPQYTLADHPEIFVVSNVMEDGRPNRSAEERAALA